MGTIREIRNAIIKELYQHLDAPIIPVESVKEKEPYPYITYNVISPYIPPRGTGNYSEKLVPSNDERFESDAEEYVDLQPTMAISINGYSRDKMEATELAHKIMAWFKHEGYQFLDDNNIVCVDVEAFGDMTVGIVDHYEARIGMDVILRFTDRLKRRFETIEEINIKKDIN